MVSIKKYVEQMQHSLEAGDIQTLKDNMRQLRIALKQDPKVDNLNWRGVDNKTGATALEFACLYGDTGLVEALLQTKKNLNNVTVNVDVNMTNPEGDTPLHLVCKAEGIALTDRINITNLLLNKGANKDAQDRLGVTPVYSAIHSKTAELPFAAFLIEKGSDLSIKNTKGKSLLDVKKNQPLLLHVLLSMNNPLVDPKKLCLAFEKNGVKLGVKDPESGMTALHIAAFQGNTELLSFLLEQGVKITNDGDNNTPLHFAASSGNLESVKLLLEKDPGQLNVQNKQQETPLHAAVSKNRAHIVRHLLNHGADRTLADQDNKTAWTIARESGYTESHNAFFDIQAAPKPVTPPSFFQRIFARWSGHKSDAHVMGIQSRSSTVTKPGFFQRLFERLGMIVLRFENAWTDLKNKIKRWRGHKMVKVSSLKEESYTVPPNSPTSIVKLPDYKAPGQHAKNQLDHQPETPASPKSRSGL